MNLQAVNKRIIVKKVYPENQPKLLILEKSPDYIVYSTDSNIVSIGDKVVIDKYNQNEIEFNNEKYIFLKEDQILAKFLP